MGTDLKSWLTTHADATGSRVRCCVLKEPLDKQSGAKALSLCVKYLMALVRPSISLSGSRLHVPCRLTQMMRLGDCYSTAQSTIARAPLRSSLILPCKTCPSFRPLTCFQAISDNGIFNRRIHKLSVGF